MYKSDTYGEVTRREILDIIAQTMFEEPYEKYHVVIGTDSQTHSKSKIVNVISIHKEGKGGFYFSRVIYIDKFHDLRTKIYDETLRSIDFAKELVEYFFEKYDLLHATIERNDKHEIIFREKNCEVDYIFEVQSDIGRNGPTAALIKEVKGMVNGYGFDCSIKPFATTASTIADRISK